MKAMIFAAGLGTRMSPITDHTPKALIEVAGVPLLEINIRRLIKHFGVTEIIVNVHHFAEQIINFLEKNNHFGIRIEVSIEREQPLETGGGLKRAAWFFDDDKPFFICNADILCEIDLNAMLGQHVKTKAAVTYAVQSRETSRYMLHDDALRLCGWANMKKRQIKIRRTKPELTAYSFSCFHVMNPSFLKTALPEDYFSMIDWYLAQCSSKKIIGFAHNADDWYDIGTPQMIPLAENLAKKLILE